MATAEILSSKIDEIFLVPSKSVKLKKRRMANRFIFGLVVLLALVPTSVSVSEAQARGASHASAGFAPRFGGSSYGHRGSAYLGAYFGDYPLFYDNSPYLQPPNESGPPIIIMRPPFGAAEPAQPKLSPLLIELEGDHYVRYGGTSRSPDRDSGPSTATSMPSTASNPHRNQSADPQFVGLPRAPLAPTVLIYHDGFREQLSDYVIVGPVLYTHNYIEGELGYGMKNINLSALDIPATIEANRENGVSFVLPAGPNEVVTRP